jgi:septum formation protein
MLKQRQKFQKDRVKQTPKIILASESPRRRELLASLGLDFDIIVSGVEEDRLEKETPEQHAIRLAIEKATSVSEQYPDAVVIGADTIVIIDNEILGKPANEKHALQMLRKLSGRTHQVITGFAILKNTNVLVHTGIRSFVTFKVLSEEELNWYVQTVEPYDKAGAYAVQGIGAFFIKKIEGSFTNVIGLPLAEIVEALRKIEAFQFKDLKC